MRFHMSWFSGLASGLANGLQHASDFVRNTFPADHTAEAPTEASARPEETTASHEAEAQTEEAAPEHTEHTHSHDIPVRMGPGDHHHMSLHHVMTLFRGSASTQYEDKARSLYSDIDGLHGKLKKIDHFLMLFSNELAAHQSVNLGAAPFKNMIPEMKRLGIEIPADLTVNTEQAAILHRSWDHARGAFEKDMEMKSHKFAEVTKDKEMINQAFLAIENNQNDSVKKILQNVR